MTTMHLVLTFPATPALPAATVTVRMVEDPAMGGHLFTPDGAEVTHVPPHYKPHEVGLVAAVPGVDGIDDVDTLFGLVEDCMYEQRTTEGVTEVGPVGEERPVEWRVVVAVPERMSRKCEDLLAHIRQGLPVWEGDCDGRTLAALVSRGFVEVQDGAVVEAPVEVEHGHPC